MGNATHKELRARIAKKRKRSPFKGKAKTPEHKKKLAAYWDTARRIKQAVVATKVNAVENKKVKDYICPTCGQVFEQVSRGVYGGHRKACLYWKEVEKWLEEDEVATIDEILEPAPENSYEIG